MNQYSIPNFIWNDNERDTSDTYILLKNKKPVNEKETKYISIYKILKNLYDEENKNILYVNEFNEYNEYREFKDKETKYISIYKILKEFYDKKKISLLNYDKISYLDSYDYIIENNDENNDDDDNYNDDDISFEYSSEYSSEYSNDNHIDNLNKNAELYDNDVYNKFYYL
jgi:hypothetical protein